MEPKAEKKPLENVGLIEYMDSNPKGYQWKRSKIGALEICNCCSAVRKRKKVIKHTKRHRKWKYLTNKSHDDSDIFLGIPQKFGYSSHTDFFDANSTFVGYNVLNLVEIYLTLNLRRDCLLMGFKGDFCEEIIKLIIYCGFMAKSKHLHRDILDLIKVLKVPTSMKQSLGVDPKHRCSIINGICFNGFLAHPKMPRDIFNCRVLLTRSFLSLEIKDRTNIYDSMLDIHKSVNSIDRNVKNLLRSNIQLVLSENHVSPDIANRLFMNGICCLGNIKLKTLNQIAFATKSSIATSIDNETHYHKFVGTIRRFRVVQKGLSSIVVLSISNHFKGYTIVFSTDRVNCENIGRAKQIVKMSLFRLQGVFEELQFVNDLGGALIESEVLSNCSIDSVCSFFDGGIVHENFSDWLDSLLHHSHQSHCESNNDREGIKMAAKTSYQLRKMTKLFCLKYYTKKNELCSRATSEAVPIGDYSYGAFLTDFLLSHMNNIKSNRCVVTLECSDSFLNHKLHFETVGSGLYQKRISVVVETASPHECESDSSFIIIMDCKKCKNLKNSWFNDLTFGRFLQLLLYNKCYVGQCGHSLFNDHQFSIRLNTHLFLFHVQRVSNYRMLPVFNRLLHNCTIDSLPLMTCWLSVYEKRLRNISRRLDRLSGTLNFDFNCLYSELPQDIVITTFDSFAFDTLDKLMFRDKDSLLSASLRFLFNKTLKIFDEKIVFLLFMDDIEHQLPCVCELTRFNFTQTYGPLNNQWSCPFSFSTYEEFLQRFNRNTVFNIELNFFFAESLRDCLKSGKVWGECKRCKAQNYRTVADFDMVNWIYIFTGVVKGFVTKMRKLLCALIPLVGLCKELEYILKCIEDSHFDMRVTYVQCVSHMLFLKYWCAKDPMHIFMIIRCFFHSVTNIFKSLAKELCFISHNGNLDEIKMAESGENSIVIAYPVCSDPNSVRIVDCKNIVVSPFISSIYETAQVKVINQIIGSADAMERNVHCEENIELVGNCSDVCLTLQEFIHLSLNYAIFSGIQNFEAGKPVKTEYMRLASKICSRIPNVVESVISVDYEPIPQSRRNIGNIISMGLFSVEYLKKFRTAFTERVVGNLCVSGSRMIDFCKGKISRKSKQKSYTSATNINFGRHEKMSRPFLRMGSTRPCGLISNSLIFRFLKRSSYSRFVFSRDAQCVFDEFLGDNLLYRVSKPLRINDKILIYPWHTAIQDYGLMQKLHDATMWRTAKVETPRQSIYTLNRMDFMLCSLSQPISGTPIVYSNHKLWGYNKVRYKKDFSSIPPMDNYIKSLCRYSSDNFLVLKTIASAMSEYLFVNCINCLSTHRIIASAQWYIGHTLEDTYSSALNNFLETDIHGNNVEFKDYISGMKASIGKETVEDAFIDVNASNNYKMRVYYPKSFHILRHFYCGDDLNFLRSLCRTVRIRSTGGKSGAPLFVTYDRKFIIKLLNKYEMRLFINEGAKFFNHIFGGDTLMSIPYGLYEVHHKKTDSTISCFLMQNIDYFLSSDKLSFDLKGISFKRFMNMSPHVQNHINIIENSKSYIISRFKNNNINFMKGNNVGVCELSDDIVLLDQNFKDITEGCPIQLDTGSLSHFVKVVKRDLDFLSTLEIVDYSLLLRIFPQDGVITIGIIDFLRPYTWDKQIETIGKRLANIGTGQAPTIVSPNEYKTRFSDFVGRMFSGPFRGKMMNSTIHRHEREELRRESFCACEICGSLDYLYTTPSIISLQHFRLKTAPNVKKYIEQVIKSSQTPLCVEDATLEFSKLIQQNYGTPTLDYLYTSIS